nr:MAG TPA: hypothetical protein [Caudoviricetes sp.]
MGRAEGRGSREDRHARRRGEPDRRVRVLRERGGVECP